MEDDRNGDGGNSSDGQDQSSISSLSEQAEKELIKEFIRIIEDQEYDIEHDEENVKFVLRKDRLLLAAERAREADSEEKRDRWHLFRLALTILVLFFMIVLTLSNPSGFSVDSIPFLVLILVTIVTMASMVYYDTSLR